MFNKSLIIKQERTEVREYTQIPIYERFLNHINDIRHPIGSQLRLCVFLHMKRQEKRYLKYGVLVSITWL